MDTFDPTKARQVTKPELMDWWYEKMKHVCIKHSVWMGDLMNTRKKGHSISPARKDFAQLLYGSVRWRNHGKSRQYAICEDGNVPDDWQICSFPDLARMITGGNHTTFIQMGIGKKKSDNKGTAA